MSWFHPPVRLVKRNGEKACYHTGEVFCLQDVVWHMGYHSADALVRTDVEVMSVKAPPERSNTGALPFLGSR